MSATFWEVRARGHGSTDHIRVPQGLEQKWRCSVRKVATGHVSGILLDNCVMTDAVCEVLEDQELKLWYEQYWAQRSQARSSNITEDENE